MFSRRRGSSANPPIDRNTSTNATTAAAQAFLQKSTSTASLSSAAAAAALRSQTASPESVADLQTKRMVRRNSASSTGSGAGSRGGVTRGGLQRTNSGGSMTERTFRSPSPGRTNGTMSPRSPSPTAPPVPALPTTVHKRASSMEPPQRVMSPTPQSGKRGGSVDRARAPVSVNTRPTQQLTNVAEAEGESPTSLSRNFSRPMSPSAGSTATKKYTHKAGPWFTGGATPSRPTTSEGLSNRRSAPSPVGTYNSDEADSVMVYDPNTRSFVQRYKPKPQDPSPTSPPTSSKPAQVWDPNTRSMVSASAAPPVPEREEPSHPPPAPVVKKARPVPAPLNTEIEPPPRNPARLSPDASSPRSPRAAGTLQKQPSVVREDPEAEAQAEDLIETAKRVGAAPVVSTPSSAPPKVYHRTTTPHQRATSLDVPRTTGSSGRGRNTSASPQRSAHFSATPVSEYERHEPPPRDISPAKSALKHSPSSSVRTASPTAVFSPSTAAGPPSETSEDTQSHDGLSNFKKKKSVRVSFDEQPKEIDSTTVTPAPVRNFDDENDDFNKPRPALPSFGSVRKNRSPEVAEKVTEMPPERHEASSDLAIGGILRNNQNQDPLPPEVTSKEASGYVSDESSDGEVPAVASAAAPEPATAGAGQDDDAGGTKVKDFAQTAEAQQTPRESLDVPEIALQPPTPGIDDETKRQLGETEEDFTPRPEQRNSMENINIPGGWGDEFESDDKSVGDQAPAQPAPVAEGPATPARSASTEDSAATQTVTPIETPAMHASPQTLSDINEDSDDTDEAEFSDAVEDPSDLEDNGGFASLDAIVESPMVTSPSIDTRTSASAADDVPESPSTKPAARAAERAEAKETAPGNWDEATSYWSQLTKEKRQQIERQHMSSDDEATPPPARKKAVAVKTGPTGSAAAAPRPKPVGILKQPSQSQPVPKQAPSQPSQAQTTMRKSMRSQQPQAATDDSVHLRSSMRSTTGSMTSRPRQQALVARPQSAYVEPRGTLQKKSMRPVSSTGVPDSSSTPNQGSSYPTLPAKRNTVQGKPEAPQVSQRLQRELTNDSDSESSFKKKRKGAAGATGVDPSGRYAMRRSMRSGSIDSQPSVMSAAEPRRPTSPTNGPARNRAFSLRSLSPNGSFFGRNRMEPAKGVDAGPRTTLRAQPASKAPPARTTLRSTPAPAPTMRAQPASKPAASSAPKSRFKSRFADSDDSDDARPARTFKSRFANSDDSDDEPAPLRPVRGIPRKQNQDDGDSTDLEEEDTVPKMATEKRQKMATPMVPDPTDVEKAMAAARRNLGVSEKTAEQDNREGDALRKGTLRSTAADEPASTPATPSEQPELKKRGFMNSILRRNRASSSSVQRFSQTSVPPSPGPATPQAANTPTVQPATPASPSPGKLVRRSSAQPQQPQLKRGDSTFSNATAPISSRAEDSNSANWPLPPPIPSNEDDGVNRATTDAARPSTSDGVSQEAIKLAQSMRPDLAPRSKSGQQLSSSSFREERAERRSVRIQAGEEGSEPGERPKDRQPGEIYSRRTGKKKKFGMLRRAFGIND
ncbi:uncharacterized protein LTR77_005204 [Saxophila tyrrhenica]|uniref:Uncharacterized protein n=1 Tax=Saxophila tyrrhenica TaxID=1690608 RepID=A0AAV9PEJ7_9PEZI|nr:hypothetical protein LTR77_005204 [Saxophila tyrrhenica]